MFLIEWLMTLAWWQIAMPLVWLVFMGKIFWELFTYTHIGRSLPNEFDMLVVTGTIMFATLSIVTYPPLGGEPDTIALWSYLWPMWAMAGVWMATGVALVGGVTLIAGLVHLVNKTLDSLAQRNARRKKRLARTDKAIRKRAGLYVSELLQLGVDEEMRSLIMQVCNETLEGRLQRRAQLCEHISAMQLDLDRSEAHTVFPKNVRKRLDDNLGDMRKMLDETQREIGEILLFLDTVESDLRVVQSQYSRRVQVEALFTKLIGRHRRQLSDQAAAIDEVDNALANARLQPDIKIVK
jgi:heme exporter protein D